MVFFLYLCGTYQKQLTLCIRETPKWVLTGTVTSSEDPDEMPHNVAFHLGLHCLKG